MVSTKHVPVIVLIGLFGCTPTGDAPLLPVAADVPMGPTVQFKPLVRPIPDIPLPNDLSLIRVDDTDSGRAWNTSTDKKTQHESHLRSLLNRLDGFGVSGSAMVSFDGPIDLATVTNEHVILINIEADHPREGEAIPVDLGRGISLLSVDQKSFFAHDPHADATSLLFPDNNRLDLDGDGDEEFIGHYEVATNTLMIQPVIPLAHGCRYAVLLTNGIYGTAPNGTKGPIRSPFNHKAHQAQAREIKRALELAQIPEADLAFGWTYTTANFIKPLVRLRDGVYGEGMFSRMADIAPAEITEIRDTSIKHDAQQGQRDHRYILQAEFLTKILEIVGQVQDDDNYNIEFKHVDYLVFGSWDTPNIRDTPRRDFAIDHHTGEGKITREKVPFMIAIPKTTEQHKPPFPVMLHFHGTGTSRFEPIAIGDTMARMGIAVMSFDQVGHGPLFQDLPRLLMENPDIEVLLPIIIPLLADILVPDRVDEFEDMETNEALEEFFKVGLFAELAVHGRAEDINNDGRMDPAESFFFPDPMRQCAAFWQDLVDMFQMVKILRGLSQDSVPSKPLENPSTASYEELKPYLLSGDFNADGVLDIGGPDVPLSLAGVSLGGLHAVMGAALEPEIRTVTPIVAGGGFTNLLARTTFFILEPTLLQVMGSVFVGCTKDDVLYLTHGNESERCRKPEDAAFASLPAPAGAAKITVTNLNNGETSTAPLNSDGGFALSVRTDIGDEIEITVHEQDAQSKAFETIAKVDGAGYSRNTSDLRRALLIEQHAFDRCDPISFARHLFWEPLPGHKPKPTLFLNAVGDRTVPIAGAINLAMAAGVFGRTEAEWGPMVEPLIAAGVLEGADYDVHDLLGDNPDDQPALGLFPPAESGRGHSSIRLANVHGKHEWIAGYNRDDFEFGHYSQHQMAIFHKCGGLVVDQPADCLQNRDCPLLDDVTALEGCNP